MQIISGIQPKPVRGVIYGPEGVGKSTLAAAFPAPVFIDVEGGTARLDVQRTPRPTTWAELRQQINWFAKNPHPYQTIVIDTADWAEALSIKQVIGQNGSKALGFGSDGKKDFGASYNQLADLWMDLLTQIDADFIEPMKMHVVFLAHSTTKKFELPEEEGEFDRYKLDLEKKVEAALKGWCDLMLFVNYRTIVNVETGSDGKVRRAKGTGGTRRIMYSQHCAAFDAKNRDGLPAEMDLGFAPIAKCFCQLGARTTPVSAPLPAAVVAPVVTPAPAPAPAPAAPASAPAMTQQHVALRRLMEAAGVTWPQVSKAVADRRKERGQGLLYPEDTPFENIPTDLIDKLFIPHWENILGAVQSTNAA